MFTTIDSEGKPVKLASEVNVDGEHVLKVSGDSGSGSGGSGPVEVTGPLTDDELRASPVPVSGPLTDTELRASPVPVTGPLTGAELGQAGLATETTLGSVLSILGDILTELQTLNAALVTANGHLAQIEANTGTSGGG